jgi:glyoxylase I family protein
MRRRAAWFKMVPSAGTPPWRAARRGHAMQIQIREIDHIVIRAADPAAMTRFYCDALGCHVEREQRELGLTQLRAGRSLIDLVAIGGPLDRDGAKGAIGATSATDTSAGAAGRNMDHLCLRVESFDGDALKAHLAPFGARPGDVVERYGAEGYGPSLYLFDPEGNMVELKGPPASR